ncbi:MAG: transcription activator effector binding protein [Ferruginibacter sp.]|nr:transcription activator effector binding protein [Ferruginibacter sp.]
MQLNFHLKSYIIPAIVLCLAACHSKDTKTAAGSDTAKRHKITIDSAALEPKTPVRKAPIVNITDTVAIKQLVLYTKDSASSSERISRKLADIYTNKLQQVIATNKLKVTGAPIAWYKTQGSPFFFEAGLPIDKKPAKLPKNFFVRSIGGDSAVVAHFFGPYDITIMGYEALNDWLTSHKKKRTAPPYEQYVGDPKDEKGKLRDPYRVQTDIIFPHN